jgi:uncharacterized membrane protein YphA (DoxX/SURF4 family)
MVATVIPETPLGVSELILRVALGGVFTYAGAAKLPDLEEFFWSVHHFAHTPWDVSMVLAMFLPSVEIIAGLALIIRKLHAGALLIVTALSAIFLGAIASAWWRGLDITCGCFGKEENATNYPKHLALNAAMLVACVGLAWIQRRERLLESIRPIEGDPTASAGR